MLNSFSHQMQFLACQQFCFMERGCHKCIGGLNPRHRIQHIHEQSSRDWWSTLQPGNCRHHSINFRGQHRQRSGKWAGRLAGRLVSCTFRSSKSHSQLSYSNREGPLLPKLDQTLLQTQYSILIEQRMAELFTCQNTQTWISGPSLLTAISLSMVGQSTMMASRTSTILHLWTTSQRTG